MIETRSTWIRAVGLSLRLLNGRKGRLTSIGKKLFEIVSVDCEARQKVSAIEGIEWLRGKGLIGRTVLGEPVQRNAIDVVGRSHPWAMCLVAWTVNLA